MDLSRSAKRAKSLTVEPIDDHHVKFRLTLDDTSWTDDDREIIHSLAIEGELALAGLEIKSITPIVYKHPYAQCAASIPPMQQIVGARIGPGFREHVIKAVGRTRGCTHFLTLALDLAAAHTLTVFLQMRSRYPFSRRNDEANDWIRTGLEIEPRLENACIALRSDSPVIRQAKDGTRDKG